MQASLVTVLLLPVVSSFSCVVRYNARIFFNITTNNGGDVEVNATDYRLNYALAKPRIFDR